MKTDIFTRIEDLPKGGEDPDFWKLINDPNLKKCFVLLILNELRRYPVEGLDDKPTRSILAKLKGYQEMIDLQDKILDPLSDVPLTSDDPFKE